MRSERGKRRQPLKGSWRLIEGMKTQLGEGEGKWMQGKVFCTLVGDGTDGWWMEKAKRNKDYWGLQR